MVLDCVVTYCVLLAGLYLQALARLLGYLIRAFVVLLCTIPAHAIFTGMEAAGDIYSKWLPTALVFALSYFVAAAHAEVWTVAVDTVLFSFLLDDDRVQSNGAPSITKEHWPELYEYLHEPDKKKSETEKQRDRRQIVKLEAPGAGPVEPPTVEPPGCCCSSSKSQQPAGDARP